MSLLNFFKDGQKENLALSDYKNIWTRFCFLDESGSLNNFKDPLFYRWFYQVFAAVLFAE